MPDLSQGKTPVLARQWYSQRAAVQHYEAHQGYSANIGEVSAGGASPSEATEACERAVMAALERLDCGPVLSSWRGHTYVVFPTTGGWGYWVDTSSCRNYVGGDRESAKHSALHHLAQNLWTADVSDSDFVFTLPPSVASEISRWIRFQRSYAALRAEGKSDVEAHRLACSG
jgi:hypothetical protein